MFSEAFLGGVLSKMVIADPDLTIRTNRMSWRSTRKPNNEDSDDQESVMLGGVRLRGEDDTGPLALEDPWWSKLTGE